MVEIRGGNAADRTHLLPREAWGAADCMVEIKIKRGSAVCGHIIQMPCTIVWNHGWCARQIILRIDVRTLNYHHVVDPRDRPFIERIDAPYAIAPYAANVGIFAVIHEMPCPASARCHIRRVLRIVLTHRWQHECLHFLLREIRCSAGTTDVGPF